MLRLRPVVWLVVLGWVLAVALPAAAASVAALLQQGDALYAQRADLAKARQAAQTYQKALAADPRSLEAAWKAARAWYWVGQHTRDEEARLAAFEKGIAAAKQAVAIAPQAPQGHYWLGVNYALYGKAKGIAKSLELIDPIKEEMHKVIALDPDFDHGGPYRVLGRLYFKVPGIFGGDNDKAIEYLKTAIAKGPRMWLNHLYLAEVYIDEDECTKAKALLKQVMAGPAPQGRGPDWQDWRRQAAELLEECE